MRVTGSLWLILASDTILDSVSYLATVRAQESQGSTDQVSTVEQAPRMLGRRVTRRRLEIALGGLWLADGLLQLQPYMFSRDFFDNVLGMAGMGVPGWFGELPHDALDLIAPAHGWFNALFALIQVAIGLGLLTRRSARLALAGSFAWGLGVWVVGEGFAGMFMPGMSMFVGAPGAVIIYVILSVILWPRTRPQGTSVAASSLLGERGALGLWVVIWAGTALLELQQANNAPGALAAALHYQAKGQPGVLAAIDRGVAQLVGMHGTEVALGFALVQVLVGFQVLAPARRRAILGLSIGVSLLYWVVGQNFGGILTGTGTDPNLGPLMVLLALTLWPINQVPSATAAPATAVVASDGSSHGVAGPGGTGTPALADLETPAVEVTAQAESLEARAARSNMHGAPDGGGKGLEDAAVESPLARGSKEMRG